MRPLRFRRRWYIGKVPGGFKAFLCAYRPSHKKQGGKYEYVIGPFRSKRGALWAERFGYGNPAFTHVDAAEKLARLREEREQS